MENTLFAIYMTSYYDYVFGFSTDIYELLEKGYGYYNNLEFIQLLKQARKERDALKVENDQLKKEIANYYKQTYEYMISRYGPEVIYMLWKNANLVDY
jgi:FtsZ-binding cell division protein ZapB